MFYNKDGSIITKRFFKDSFEVDKHHIYIATSTKFGSPKIRNMERNKKERLYKAHTFVIPLGAEHHKFDRGAIKGICNLRAICMKNLIEDILEPLLSERDQAIIEKNKTKIKNKELEKENHRLRGRLEERIMKEPRMNPMVVAPMDGSSEKVPEVSSG
jgi:hypothetical protein